VLIYVMGRGHSGSTLLDSVLSADPDVEGVGEIVAAMGRYDKSCSCGESIGDCPFWVAVRAEAERVSDSSWADLVAVNQRQARVQRFPATLAASARSSAVRRQWELLVAPLQAVRSVAGVPVVVDSSKEATRALFFSRFVPGVVIVHLVRDPSDVVASDLHRIRNGTFRFQRRQIPTGGHELPFLILSAVGWLVTNGLCELVARRGSAPVVSVRYEELCDDPVAVIHAVAAAAGRSFDVGPKRVAAGGPLSFGHKIGGNAIRLDGPVTVARASSHKRAITGRQMRIVRLITKPLRGRYGY